MRDAVIKKHFLTLDLKSSSSFSYFWLKYDWDVPTLKFSYLSAMVFEVFAAWLDTIKCVLLLAGWTIVTISTDKILQVD